MALFLLLVALEWVVVAGFIVAMWWLSRTHRRLFYKIGSRLQRRACAELELIDRVGLVVEDLIRVEPERADILEITRLDLSGYRHELEGDLSLFIAVATVKMTDMRKSLAQNCSSHHPKDHTYRLADQNLFAEMGHEGSQHPAPGARSHPWRTKQESGATTAATAAGCPLPATSSARLSNRICARDLQRR